MASATKCPVKDWQLKIWSWSFRSEWKATVDRLTGFAASLEKAREKAQRMHGERNEMPGEGLAIENLELELQIGMEGDRRPADRFCRVPGEGPREGAADAWRAQRNAR